jgi:hypothetical protein
MKTAANILLGNVTERYHLGDKGVDVSLLFK